MFGIIFVVIFEIYISFTFINTQTLINKTFKIKI